MRGIIIDPNSRDGIKRLSREQKGELLDAIFSYNIDGEIIEMSDMTGMAFDMMRGFFDKQIIQYKNTCVRNAENGKKGGRPIKEPTQTHDNPENPLGYLETHSKPTKLKETKTNETKTNEILISSKEDTTESIVVEEKEYGKKEINMMQKFLRRVVGLDKFKDKKERWFVTHCYNLMKDIGKDEFSFRLKKILSDPFKAKKSNELEYLYGELKSFIHSPVVETVTTKRKVYGE